ncbi:aminoacyl-tRNA hydrolase [Spirillospora sp. CA-142024]|uniref:aminoacyl-tRNA hydrolase n=1 Tax=Spirillospora sp. CA-142024 TaxID=3240036 RepID=UPI003D908348
MQLVEEELRWGCPRSGRMPPGQDAGVWFSPVSLSLNLTTTTILDGEQREHALQRLGNRVHVRAAQNRYIREDGAADGVVTVMVMDEWPDGGRRNRELAREWLAALISEAIDPDKWPRYVFTMSTAAKQRRRQAKHHRSQLKRARRCDE